jgi:multidrug efflux pump subunit AcrB
VNFATWAIRQPIPPIVLFMLFTGVGLYGFGQLNVQDMPDMEFPMVTVTAVLPGASPSQLETEVTRRIENAIVGIEGIEQVTSNVTEGSSTTAIQFRLEHDLFEALNDVRAAVANTRASLPPEMEDPIVNKVNAAGMPIRTYTVASSVLDEEALSWFVDNTLTRTLTAIPGLAAVDRIGGVDREVRVDLDPAQLAALQVTAADVSRQLRRAQQQMSGGRGEVGDARQSLRTIATVASAAELGGIDIVLPGGRHVRLDRIATIHDTVADRRQVALLDGRPVVAFQIQRSRDGNAVEVAEQVDRTLAELARASHGLEFAVVNDFVRHIQDEYEASMLMLWEGALLAMLVVWLFLRDWRATLISALALPLSVIPTFAFMYWLDFSLNVVTLLALSLVVGLLVDDTIVEVENIVRHLRMGKTPLQAATDAAVEIGLAVVATTMTLVAVFLPTAFMSGIAGLVFRQFGWTAVVAVLASLVVARLITPMLSARLLRPHVEAAADGPLMRGYLAFARAALRHPLLTAVLSAAFFAASLVSLAFLPQGFVPQTDQGRTQLSIELAPGTPLAVTHEMAEHVRGLIADIPEITSVFTTIGAGSGGGMSSRGGGPPAAGDLRKASLAITMLPTSERARSQPEIENEVRARLRSVPGVRFAVGFGGTGEKAQITLSSEDGAALKHAADAVMAELRAVPGFGNVGSSAALLRPEIIIRPDFARAAELGVSAAAIGETVQVATAGDYSAALAKLNLPERQVDIRVQLPLEARRDLATIEQLRVPGSRGLVPLSAVADVSVGSGPAQVSRLDRSRNVTIDVELAGTPLGEATQRIDALPSVRSLPAGVRKADFGDAQRMQELFDAFGIAMATGIACVFFVLVLLFKDFLQPMTILAALPLSVGGAVIALVAAGEVFSMPATIGLLMLMGIVTKNSILLVEYAVVAMRERGLGAVDALLDACRKRARPIVMTTLAMAAGMVPVALGLDADTSFRAPMAIVVIGGLVTSTVLSLVVVPVVFLYVLRFEGWLRRCVGVHGQAFAREAGDAAAGGG